MNEGSIGEYKWIECVHSGAAALDLALQGLRHHVAGLRAVNVSWDSGLYVPSHAEQALGWKVRQGRAISPVIDATVVEGWPWCDGGGYWEEWYFFTRLPQDFKLSAFCNWSGVSLANWTDLVGVPTAVDLGKQLAASQPELVLGVGWTSFGITRNPTILSDLRQGLEAACANE